MTCLITSPPLGAGEKMSKGIVPADEITGLPGRPFGRQKNDFAPTRKAFPIIVFQDEELEGYGIRLDQNANVLNAKSSTGRSIPSEPSNPERYAPKRGRGYDLAPSWVAKRSSMSFACSSSTARIDSIITRVVGSSSPKKRISSR